MWLREHKLLAVVALLVVVIGVAISVLSRDESRRLPEGSELFLRRVSYGQLDRWIAGPLWERLIARFAPAKVSLRRFQTRVWTLANTNDVLFLWIEWKVNAKANVTNMSASSLLVGVVEPGSGLEEAPIVPQYWIPTSATTALMAYQVPNFPRRSSRVLLRLYERNPRRWWTPVAEFTLRNPARTTRPPATSEHLPQARTNGLRTFTLTSLTTGLEDRSAPKYSPIYSPLTWTALSFETGGPDETAGGWAIRSVQCSDRSGNVILEQRVRNGATFEGAAYSSSNDRQAMFAGALWPDDLWKLRVAFEPGRVPAEDRVLFRGLPIPPPGGTNTLTNTAQIHGSTIRLLSISSPVPTPMAETNRLLRTRKPVTVVAHLTPSVYTDELRCTQATDDLGTNAYRLGNIPRTPQDFRLLVSKEARTVDLELGVQRLRHVEFVARPSVTRTNVHAWKSPDARRGP